MYSLLCAGGDVVPTHYSPQLPVQDPLYRPQYHLSLKDFRALTLERLVRFTEQRFFQTSDYMNGAELGAQEGICCYAQRTPGFSKPLCTCRPAAFPGRAGGSHVCRLFPQHQGALKDSSQQAHSKVTIMLLLYMLTIASKFAAGWCALYALRWQSVQPGHQEAPRCFSGQP